MKNNQSLQKTTIGKALTTLPRHLEIALIYPGHNADDFAMTRINYHDKTIYNTMFVTLSAFNITVELTISALIILIRGIFHPLMT